MLRRFGIFNNHTHTHPFNGPFSGTTQISRYQKGKTNLDFTEARDSEWQWHQLGYMQVCTSLQSDNHTSTPSLSFYRPDALPAAQPTASKHWRQGIFNNHFTANSLKNLPMEKFESRLRFDRIMAMSLGVSFLAYPVYCNCWPNSVVKSF